MEYNEKTSTMVGEFIKQNIVDIPLFENYSHLDLNHTIQYYTPLFTRNYVEIKSLALVYDHITPVCKIIIKDNYLMIDIANIPKYKRKNDYNELYTKAYILFNEVIVTKYTTTNKWQERN